MNSCFGMRICINLWNSLLHVNVEARKSTIMAASKVVSDALLKKWWICVISVSAFHIPVSGHFLELPVRLSSSTFPKQFLHPPWCGVRDLLIFYNIHRPFSPPTSSRPPYPLRNSCLAYSAPYFAPKPERCSRCSAGYCSETAINTTVLLRESFNPKHIPQQTL